MWLNGNLVGGWPFGYASWELDLTPYVQPGGDNQLAIRISRSEHAAVYPDGVRDEEINHEIASAPGRRLAPSLTIRDDEGLVAPCAFTSFVVDPRDPA